MNILFTDARTSLRMEGRLLPVLTQALVAAGVRPVQDLKLLSLGSAEPEAELTIRISEIGYDVSIPLHLLEETPIAPSVSRDVENRLEAVARPTEAVVEILLGERVVERRPLTLLPPWHWPHDRNARVAVATYVLPGDSTVSRLLADAGHALQGGGAALSELVADPARRPELLIAIYRQLSEARAIEYDTPKIERDDARGMSHQLVKAPGDILPAWDRGRGNCLDLTLLLAGCLEALSLNPLVFFTESPGDAPDHAFLGCWRERADRFRPLLPGAEELRSRVASGEIVAIEATGVCAGERRLSPEASLAAAGAMALARPCHAVDVSASRPPSGTVRPLVPADHPVVRRAIQEGESMADRLHARQRETMHVLYGLCAAAGEITTRVLERSGSSPRAVMNLMDQNLKDEGSAEPPKRTKNYEICLGTARSHARNRGSSVVEEGDLLHAVVFNPSRNVKRILEASGSDMKILLEELEQRWGGYGEVTLSREFRKGE